MIVTLEDLKGVSELSNIPDEQLIMMGEGIEDLQLFRRREFVNSLFGE